MAGDPKNMNACIDIMMDEKENDSMKWASLAMFLKELALAEGIDLDSECSQPSNRRK